MHNDMKGDNRATCACKIILNSWSIEEGNNEKNAKMEQTENQTMTDSNSQDHNVVASHRKNEAMIVAQITRTTKKMVGIEILTLVAKYFAWHSAISLQ